MAARRRAQGSDRSTFMAHFAGDALDVAVLEHVYEYLERWNGGSFPVRPDDDISDVYGIVDEDLDDLVLESARACGCRVPTKESVRGMPLRTVENLIRLLQAHK